MINVDTLLQELSKKTVLVVGDVMIDRYLWGAVDRVSPEAPVPVLDLEASENRLGGAANVAMNIKALGAQVVLCGIVGADVAGNSFHRLMEREQLSTKTILTLDNAKTTVKTRVIGSHQHLLRVDDERFLELADTEASQFMSMITEALNDAPDLVIIQDYNKGSLTSEVIAYILDSSLKLQIPVAVDPKDEHFFAYSGVALFKPNLKEIRQALRQQIARDMASLHTASNLLRAKLKHHLTCITLSDKGIFLDDGQTAVLIETDVRQVVDVCGAGDAVISIVALANLISGDLNLLGHLGNLAGGIVCEEVGVCPINMHKLKSEIQQAELA